MTAVAMRMFPDRNPPAKAEPAPVVEEVKVEKPAEVPAKETAATKIKRKITRKE